MECAKNLSIHLKKATKAKRIGMVVEGFLVPHVHIHLVPMNNGGDLHPEKAKKASNEQLAKTAEMIRSVF
jgi:histidine triad (HIT) family protein